VTKPSSFNTTDLPLDSTPFDLEINDNPERTLDGIHKSYVSGIYDYESSQNFDSYLQVSGKKMSKEAIEK